MTTEVEQLYERYGPMVLRRCRRLLREEEQAVDAMQDVFVQLLRQRRSLAAGAPSSLLFRIATNVCLNRMRSQRRCPEDSDDELVLRIAHAGDLEERSAAKALLRRVFGGAPESTGAIAVMHLLDGLTHEEVAERVGLSVSGVRKRLRSLKAKLSLIAQEVS